MCGGHTLHPSPYTLHTLHPTPYTPYTPYTLQTHTRHLGKRAGKEVGAEAECVVDRVRLLGRARQERLQVLRAGGEHFIHH